MTQEQKAKLEYKRVQSERRRKGRAMYERALSAGVAYPMGLERLWDYMQEKGIGIRFCLGMIYSIGLLDGIKQGGEE